MAFETGTATNIAQLINVRLKDFMVAQGWTLNADNWPDHLALSKDGCFVNLRYDIETDDQTGAVTGRGGNLDFDDDFGVARQDRVLWAHLSSGYTAGGWGGQPDSAVVGTDDNTPFARVNDLLGPFPSYTFFSGDESAGEPAYIYAVIETRVEHYSHLLFGNIEQIGLGYSPNAAFLVGSFYHWWADRFRNDVSWASVNHRMPFSGQGSAWDRYFQVYPGGAMPGALVRPRPAGDRDAVPLVIQLGAAGLPDPDPDFGAGFLGTRYGLLNAQNIFRGPLNVGGVTPLHSIPILVESDADADVIHYLGQASNIRMCSMFDLTPGQVIEFGDDDWIVFPARKQAPRGNMSSLAIPSPGITNTSFQYGLAFKRVI